MGARKTGVLRALIAWASGPAADRQAYARVAVCIVRGTQPQGLAITALLFVSFQLTLLFAPICSTLYFLSAFDVPSRSDVPSRRNPPARISFVLSQFIGDQSDSPLRRTRRRLISLLIDRHQRQTKLFSLAKPRRYCLSWAIIIRRLPAKLTGSSDLKRKRNQSVGNGTSAVRKDNLQMASKRSGSQQGIELSWPQKQTDL